MPVIILRSGSSGTKYRKAISARHSIWRPLAKASAVFLFACSSSGAHDLITTKITWSREISRLMGEKCAGCHRAGGSSFPLTTYLEVRPWAKAIKEEVLQRRMPPFGAVKGFSELKGDESLTQEQIGLISSWVEGGAPEGNPALLPQASTPKPKQTSSERAIGPSLTVSGSGTLTRTSTFTGVAPAGLKEGSSVRVVAQDPSGKVTPLLWLYQYRKRFDRAYYFRKPLTFSARTRIIAQPAASGSIALLEGAGPVDKSPAVVAAKPDSADPPRSLQSSAGTTPLDYVCPMDPDVRSAQPGRCSRCGMTLKLGIPEANEYGMDLTAPANLRPRQAVELEFRFFNPQTGSTVRNFEIMHEKLFHLFIVSGDLQHFEHVHPTLKPDGTFSIRQKFPRAGMYRVVADIYPVGGTPQLLSRTLFVPSDRKDAVSLTEANLTPDEELQHGENTNVQVVTYGLKAVAGMKTHLAFRFDHAEGMQMYLGAWAHMFIASDDTIDVLHVHPTIANGGQELQFYIIFPRARTYRVWLQFQRNNVVNTIAVNIPVSTMEQAFGLNATR